MIYFSGSNQMGGNRKYRGREWGDFEAQLGEKMEETIDFPALSQALYRCSSVDVSYDMKISTYTCYCKSV